MEVESRAMYFRGSMGSHVESYKRDRFSVAWHERLPFQEPTRIVLRRSPTRPATTKQYWRTLPEDRISVRTLRYKLLTLPTSSNPVEDPFERNKRSFMSQLTELSRNPKYFNKYVAIVEGKITDADSDKKTLVKRVYTKLGYGPVYVGHVTKKKVIELPSPEKR